MNLSISEAPANERAHEEFSRYDVVDYLTDDESIAAFLEALANEAGDDQVQIDQALEAVARARVANRLNRSL